MDSWNHNTHHHPLLLRLLPERGGAVLDVGCGDGSFASLLAQRYAEVVALDADAEQVALTADRCTHQSNVSVQHGDFLTTALPSGHFDAVTALASFHHMPFQEAAAEARRVLKPGGRLLVLGVWTDSATVTDLAFNVASTALNLMLRWRRGPDTMTAPATMNGTSWSQVKAAAAEHLPNARVQRRLLWRYTLVWDKPAEA